MLKKLLFLLLSALLLLGICGCRAVKFGLFYLSKNHQRPRYPVSTLTPDSSQTFRFHPGDPSLQAQVAQAEFNDTTLEAYLADETGTTAFLVIRNDSLIYEGYYDGYQETSILPSFSVAKSFTSALVGIALAEGLIASIEDPVTAYLPELSPLDSNWSRLRIEHLLDMRSGLDFNEDSYANPYADIASLYLKKDALKFISKAQFAHLPGTHHYYSSQDTQILGLIIERVTGEPLAKYLENKIWQPLGMEYPATWYLDSKKSGHNKAFCCLQVAARDYAKFGRLFLNGGSWEGKQLIDPAWVARSVEPNFENDCYQNQWYSGGRSYLRQEKAEGGSEIWYFPDSISATAALENQIYARVLKSQKYPGQWYVMTCGPQFYALGIFGQEIYVEPERNLIFVRLGEKWDLNNHRAFSAVIRALE
ncbi:MAG: serine hydrolase [Bacteroidota bacterium]